MFSDSINVGNKIIGPNHAPFIIAEMSGNHNQSLDRALELVDAAADAGAHALKIQTYTADTMTIDSTKEDFVINDKKSLWSGEKLYDLYKKAYTPWEWHKPIFDRCKEKGMIGFSTPFDDTAVDFLLELDTPLFKIASFENTHLPLIERVAKTGKPMIVSTGMATLPILEDIVRTVEKTGNQNLILLKCTSTYPATPEDSNILTIPHLKQMFGTQVGLSDHTMGVGVAVGSIALGATVVEKHFTLRRADGGVDSAFSLEPEELNSLVIETERCWQGLGKVNYQPTGNEKKSLQFRRSIYVTKDIKAGEAFTSENTRIIRPGFGLEPKHWQTVLKSKASSDLEEGHALSFKDLS